MGFWDDPAVKPASNDYVKFEKIGDQASGTITKLGKRTFGSGPDERVAVEVNFDDAPTVTAGQILLQRALFELTPEPGDFLRVTLADIDKTGGKTLKKWQVYLRRADGDEVEIDQAAG